MLNDNEFSKGDIVSKVHFDTISKDHRVVKMEVKKHQLLSDGHYRYTLNSIEKDFSWLCTTTENFIIESKYFAIFESRLICQEYQILLEQMKAGQND